MRKIAASALTATLAGSLLMTLGSSPAPAATPTRACVTKAEFAQAKPGMTRGRIASIFGTDGRLVLRMVMSGHAYTQRQYPPCPAGSYVSVSYRDARLTGKSAHWGALPGGEPQTAAADLAGAGSSSTHSR